MSNEQRTEVIDALVQFVVRASKEGAIEAEVAVLPTIAQILLANWSGI